MLYSSIFKTIEDEASSSGYRITNIFSQLFSDIRNSSQGISFSTGFSETLNNDISCITAYKNAVAAGTEAATAFDNTMLTASMSAVEYATSMDASKLSVEEFTIMQKQAEVAVVAQNKTLKNVKSIIAEYNNGCKNTELSQTQFIEAVNQSNTGLGRYLSGLNGANASMGGYVKSLLSAKIATLGMRVATLALNTAISMGVSALVSVAIQALSNWINKAKEAREAALETASSAKSESENIQSLYQAYQSAWAAYQNGSGTKEAYTSATESLCEALGIEESEVDSLISKYGDLHNAINQVTIDQLKQDLQDMTNGLRAAEDELVGAGAAEQNRTVSYGNDDETKKVLKALKAYDGFTSNANPLTGGFFDLDGGIGNIGAVKEMYEDILRYEEMLEQGVDDGYYTRSELADSSFYQNLEEKKSKFQEQYEAYMSYVDGINEASAEIDVLEYINSNGIPETAEEYNALKQSILDSADASGSFVGSQEDIENAVNNVLASYPGLENFYSAAEQAADTTSDRYKQAAAAITESAEQAAESATTLISGITAVQDALNGQQTGKSISIEDFNSDELKDYQSALEYTNGTMQLNAEKVREIAKAKADEQVAINNTNKALEQTKYLENAKEIEQLRDSLASASDNEKESIQSSIDALLAENSTIAATCDQYDLLSASIQEAVGSYQNWLNAQSASDYGDMADDTVDAIQRIRDTFDEDSDIYGQVGSKKFEAAVEFAVPDSVDRDDVDAIESWKDDFSQYLNFDDDGNVDSLNIDQFLSNAVKEGLMNYDDENGFTVAGQKSMEDFAEGLNMSSGMVQAFFDELQLYGGEFDWSDEAVKTIGDLAVEANEAAEALRGVDEFSSLKIKMDVSDLDTTDEQVAALDATIEEMNGVKAKVSVDSSEAENANAVIQYCITQKQLLTQPDVMRVDTSQVEGDIGNALSLLQQFQEAQNNLEIQAAIGADTSDAQAKVDSLTTEIQNLSPDIKTKLSLDSTSTESIKTSIAGLSAETINVKANVDASAISGYSPESKTCDVIYNPDTDALPTSFADINRTVNYVPVTSSLPSSFKTITRYVKYVKTGDVSVNGTAHASGTANASGNWGTATGGETLVGELGQELVVDTRTGQWYTVGDNGAEFRDIPAGAIVFNHRQTEDLLANGYVAGRAHALVNGTAMVTGGIKRPRPGGGSSNTGSSGSSTGSSGSGNSSSSSSGSSSSSSSDNSSSSDEEDSTKIIDWIEIAIDRIERAIDRLSTIASSSFRTLSERLGATNDELSQMSYEMSLQQSAYDRYIQEANSVGLSSDLADKVRNGTIDINEYDSDTAENIEKFQEYYEKALDAQDKMLDLQESIAELYQDKFDTVADDYENQLSLLEHLTNTYNNGIDDIEERGYLATTKYYEALQNVEQKNIDVRKQELSDLIAKMSEGVNSGSIAEYSDEWYKMQQEINDVKEAIQESETAMIEFGNSIREVKWEHFDYLQEQISNITEEADFLIDLMENSDLYTDNGQLTDTGMATMGLHGQNYNVYMAQADKYAEELLKLNKELAEDPYNTKLLERREELLESQRDAILAAEDEKDAIVDMVREGIELELDALQDLIDKYEDSLESAKDLYDYQKRVKEQTEEISSLQKQLSAYSGDTSEETKATVQKLQVDLSDAMEDLQETEYEQYISETKKLLDNLYTEFEMILNERLDNIDALISDMIDTINANSSSISDTLLAQADKVGYTISDSIQDIWSNEGGAFTIITKYGESFLTQLTTVNDVISKIAYKIGAMVAESDKTAQTTVDKTTSTTPTDKSKKPTTPKPPTTDTTKKTTFNDDIKRGIAAAIWIYGSKSGWGNNPQRKNRLTEKFGSANASAVQSYINAHSSNGDLYKYWVSTGKSKLSQYYYSAFKKGGLADYTGMAWMDGTPSEPEMVLNPEDTANFIALKDAMQSVANGDSPLAELFGGNGSSNILEQLAKIESPLSGQSTSVGDITYQVTIPIDHVQDYEDFMNQMRKDGKFEKMIQSMTVDRLVGGSKLAKNRYQW